MLTPVFLFLILDEDSYYDVVTNDLLRNRLSKIAYNIEHHSLDRNRAITAICNCSILTEAEAVSVLDLIEKECLHGKIQN
jgi:hypothetical protein